MNRRGFVLPLVLLSLALMGALAGAVMLGSRLRWQSGKRSLEALQAHAVAESEVARLIAGWDPLLADSMLVGAVAAIPASSPGHGISAADSVMRLGQGLYLVGAVGLRTAADGTLLARDGIAELIRLESPTLPDSMAVSTAGPLDVTDAGQIDGIDHVPSGWTGWCPAPAAPGAGVMAAIGPSIGAHCTSGSCISGGPPIATDSALSAAVIHQRGAMSFSELLAAADHRVGGTILSVGPVVTGGRCSITDSLNWGDPSAPSAPCGSFFPVIEAAPGTIITSGQGQGLLLATGALELAGNAAFSGVVLAAGPMLVRDQARVTGLVMAEDSLLVAGSAIVERSRCVMARVSRGAARPGKRVSRGWFRWN